MSKMLSKISEYKGQGSVVKGQEKGQKHPNLLFWLLATGYLLLSFVSSCAPKHVELPSYEGIHIENALSELKDIKSIEAVLSVEYEKNDSSMSGDASLNVSEDKLNLRLYYLGFLAGEVSEDKGIIKSKPKLDKNKSTILIDGLKNSFFWWNIKDYTLQEKEDAYELKNSYRKLLISKKTLLPVQQTIELNDGEELKIFYDVPAKSNNESTEGIDQQNQPSNSKPIWYNSRLKIEFKNYIVKIKVKSYSAIK
ncbi:MAG: hypothetical protein QMD44_06570 [Thermodesulfovibrionales bacterium]|jgi:outer membrane lipoprotein-sorting protein|nr:hypothetical protein [Thermodesulfovibrionales bacterium]